VFDILATIVGEFDDEADILAFAQDLEDCVVRAACRGIAIEVRDNRLAAVIRKRARIPSIIRDQER
jgi:hypothetical protein